MFKPPVSRSTPAVGADVKRDVAAVIALELAVELSARDAITTAALCAVRERDLGRTERYRFWLDIFKFLKSNPEFLPDFDPAGSSRAARVVSCGEGNGIDKGGISINEK